MEVYKSIILFFKGEFDIFVECEKVTRVTKTLTSSSTHSTLSKYLSYFWDKP